MISVLSVMGWRYQRLSQAKALSLADGRSPRQRRFQVLFPSWGIIFGVVLQPEGPVEVGSGWSWGLRANDEFVAMKTKLCRCQPGGENDM